MGKMISRLIAMHELYVAKSGELLIPPVALQVLELIEDYGIGKIDYDRNNVV